MEGTLYGRPLLILCLVTFAGYGSNSVVQTLLPVLVLAIGGDATTVGAAVAVFSLPSIFLRPFIGRSVDELSLRKTHLIGTAFLGVVPFAYVLPFLSVIFAARFISGAAWAAFNTAGETTLLAISPLARRAEAAATYRLMPSLANIALPTLGLWLFGAFGLPAAFSFAATLGLVGAAVLAKGPVVDEQRSTGSTGRRWWQDLIESSALLPMALSGLFAATTILFLVYPPVFVATLGIPVTELTVYYPAIGASLLLSRVLIGRWIDRIPRSTTLLAGTVLLTLALIIAAGADSVATLTVAGVVHGAANALFPAVTMAAAMERARPHRRGSTMATYSMGYQVGVALGATVWGLLIDAFGFPWPFIAAISIQVAIACIVVARRSGLTLDAD